MSTKSRLLFLTRDSQVKINTWILQEGFEVIKCKRQAEFQFDSIHSNFKNAWFSKELNIHSWIRNIILKNNGRQCGVIPMGIGTIPELWTQVFHLIDLGTSWKRACGNGKQSQADKAGLSPWQTWASLALAWCLFSLKASWVISVQAILPQWPSDDM